MLCLVSARPLTIAQWKHVGNPCCFISLLYRRLERNSETTSSCGQVFSYWMLLTSRALLLFPLSWMICLHLCAAGTVGVTSAEKGYCSRSAMLSCNYKTINMGSCNKRSQLPSPLVRQQTYIHDLFFLPLLSLKCFDSVLSDSRENILHILSIFFSWPDLILSLEFQIYCSVPIPQILKKSCFLLLS